jgi:hypothetical protein
MTLRKAWLADGTPVEVIKESVNEIGITECQIKPDDAPSFASGVNPWVPKYALCDQDPMRSALSDERNA